MFPIDTTWYTAGTARRVCGQPCCAACGQLPRSHHPGGRCYTPEDLRSRLAWYHHHGRWPGPDEGCALDVLAP